MWVECGERAREVSSRSHAMGAWTTVVAVDIVEICPLSVYFDSRTNSRISFKKSKKTP